MNLRKLIRICCLLGILIVTFPESLSAQEGTWVWMGGSQQVNDTPVLGIQGIPDTGNIPPSLYEAANWTDNQGNLWLFGGLSVYYNYTWGDLWKYDVTSHAWTWVKGPGIPNTGGVYGTLGIPSPNNHPGARGYGAVTWTDNNGLLWLFGGDSYSDLWSYNINTNEWTWMSGNSSEGDTDVYGTKLVSSHENHPGNRSETNSGWVDNFNNLWLFGGEASDPNTGAIINYNDMWKYSTSTNEWTWMSGSQKGYNPGSYGQMDVEDSSNLPPGRCVYTRWKDVNGNFYIWGGGLTDLSDVWRYNPSNNNWTWVAGDSTADESQGFETYCLPGGKHGPGARSENRTAQTIGFSNIFVGFGGAYYYGGPEADYYNDLWSFNASTLSWALNKNSATDSYGTKGVLSSSNQPIRRCGMCVWTDNERNVWMYGGLNANYGNGMGTFNDLWEFIPSFFSYTLSNNKICLDDTAKLTLTGIFDIQIQPSTNVTWIDSLHLLLSPISTTTYYITGTSNCGGNVSDYFTVIVIPTAIQITSSKSIICFADSAQLCAPSGFASYSWNNGSSSQCFYTPIAGNYFVSVADNNECVAISNQVSISVATPISDLTISSNNTFCSGDSVQLCVLTSFASYSWNNSDTAQCFYTRVAGNYSVTVADNNGCTAASNQVNISEQPAPYANFGQKGDTLEASNAYSYQWLLNGLPVAGASSNIYIAKDSGNYSLQVTDSVGCVAASNPVLIDINPIPENGILIFPNPTGGTWQVKVGNNIIGSQMELHDELGRIIYKSVIAYPQSEINIPGLAQAEYELRIITANNTIVKKLIKLTN